MPVTYRIVADSAEELSEPLRRVAKSVDGKFVVEGLPDGFAIEDVKGLRNTVGKLRGELGEVEPFIKALRDAGISKAEEIAVAMDALGKVRAGQLKTPADIEAFKAEVQKKHSDEMSRVMSVLEKRTSKLRDREVRGRLSPIVAAKGGTRAMDAILTLAEKHIQVKEGADGDIVTFVAGSDGQPRLTKKVGSMEPMGFEELIDEMRESQSTRGLFDVQAAGGSGSTSQSGGPGPAGNQDSSKLSARDRIQRANEKAAAAGAGSGK